jgi:Cu/Ag efflux pump CusA
MAVGSSQPNRGRRKILSRISNTNRAVKSHQQRDEGARGQVRRLRPVLMTRSNILVAATALIPK